MKWRLASGYFAYFLCGWGDGVTGTVLPYFTAEFHLTAMTSSLLFAGSTCGFAFGTVLVESILKALGRIPLGAGRNNIVPPRVARLFSARNSAGGYSASQARSLTLAIACILHGVHFIMIGLKGGFGVTFLAYAVAAFARALLTGELLNPIRALGYSYAFWSFGGVMSPIICQSIVASGVPWFHFYFGSLVLSGLNTTFLISSFKPTRREFQKEREPLNGLRSPTETISSSNLPSPTNERDSLPLSNAQPVLPPPANMFRVALTMPYQWAFSIFAMIYCGSETATQGFMVTYLLATRNANPKTVGYVTSGFWGGITIGRLTWGYASPRLNFTQKKFVILGSMCVFFYTFLIWFVDSTVQNSVSASIFGVLYGPIFPACLSMANSLLPSEVHMVSMTLISTFASIGSSLFPFIAGVISSTKGAHTLTYLTVPLGITMICLWSLFPSRIPVRIHTN
ncbi:major facilitator superfamily domain-containing protein [Collybia nuda]|uniref:Major facilitator superfamily domain-containing protein n=1 Tax=Collybia nuda TaxID=64659 RepID=A0A9P6CG05_9AGAR|nr:major facilitator superfamily domain-containing protein [Collybia nuda]